MVQVGAVQGSVSTGNVVLMSSAWLTRANALTLLRLLATPVLVCAIVQDRAWIATTVYFGAVLSDFLDGWVARRYAEASPLGGLVDHGVDATFVVCGTAALATLDVVPVVLPCLIALAFIQYALDSRLGASHGDGLRASWLGRWNGISYYVIVAVPIVRDALALGWPSDATVMALGWVLVVSTLVSVADRLRRSAASRRAPGSPA